MTRKLILNAVAPNDKKIATTISNANPAASDSVLESFAKKICDLTDNTYVSTSKVDTTELNSL